ncbi:MAG: 23S rRNA (adenine(2503)-C(2))-methyltransferase RlmN [Clostridia bacterium]|nr:23S rRNA (adenine(2503)-C(2))-methyltransferase RlmN [Clostridia bacterium]MDE7329044.1 23S rRNA (adenine(2503)-C(2))-methyltransferase RlmN [Clostridia bacterium]
MNKKLLVDYSIEELAQVLDGQPKFRAEQLFKWLSKGAAFEEMKNLPKPLIERLADGYLAQGAEIAKEFKSAIDGTVKYLYKLADGNMIEGVLMKYKYGNTLCVSTQVGCRMNCAFCASGLDGLIRNLSAGEILGQVIAVNRRNFVDGERGVTNIVLMGSGEPLDNYENVCKFLTLVSDERGLNISKRNISLSTCGLCDKIIKLADDGYSPTLTISLHAPNDELRKQIMPIAKKYTIADIIKAVKYYFDKTGRRIIFEYSMIAGKNDSEACARELAKAVKGLPCHINLIPLNFVKERGLDGSNKKNVYRFMAELEKQGISVTVRRSMGSDIEGACGQLRRKVLKDEND